MKVVIPGGSGQVGTLLARTFQREGHDVVVLSRQAAAASWPVVRWDAETLGDWVAHLDGADAVINLAGRSVNCRYTPANRRAIVQSRVLSTRVVGQALARVEKPPRAWLQASTATIYLSSPAPVTNAEFMRVLREAWGARIGLPATKWMLEVGAMFLRTETELVLKSRRVVPSRLLRSGFPFLFPQWPAAAAELCARAR